jgi:hypothetical protein
LPPNDRSQENSRQEANAKPHKTSQVSEDAEATKLSKMLDGIMVTQMKLC